MEKEIEKKILKAIEIIKDYLLANVEITRRLYREIQEINRELRRIRGEKDGDKSYTKT